MNPTQARQLIKDTFSQTFDKARFRAFALNLLNHVDEDKAFRQTLVKEAYREGISHYERLVRILTKVNTCSHPKVNGIRSFATLSF